ncbi:hypothetical protein GQ457_15G016590 [Hibiscus cannabinus]
MEETNVPSCFCGRPASLRTAWTDNNAGRRFYGCANHGHGFRRRSCNFFSWYDPPLNPRSRAIIVGLLRKVKAMERGRRSERIM